MSEKEEKSVWVLQDETGYILSVCSSIMMAKKKCPELSQRWQGFWESPSGETAFLAMIDEDL